MAECTICGAAVRLRPGDADDNTLCQGCAPNLAASLDVRLRLDALWLEDELVRVLLEGES